MYTRFVELTDFKLEYLDDLVIKLKGKTKLDGEIFYPYELLKYESGVHRVQRVPVTESQGRIHTSTASVAVLPEIHQSAVEIRDEDLTWQFIRAGGAGGQSVNKTSSAVRLTHEPSGIAVTSSRERKQAQNRQIALELLRSQLWEIEEEKKAAKEGQARSAIGRAMRAEKIRTYNYPQNRVTDHRINVSWHNLESILDGDLTKLLLEIREQLAVKLTPADQS
jgi:peptide chain release factor 1